jgi:hypothetical protein
MLNEILHHLSPLLAQKSRLHNVRGISFKISRSGFLSAVGFVTSVVLGATLVLIGRSGRLYIRVVIQLATTETKDDSTLSGRFPSPTDSDMADD